MHLYSIIVIYDKPHVFASFSFMTQLVHHSNLWKKGDASMLCSCAGNTWLLL